MNPIKPHKIQIQLDQPREIHYNLNAFCELEERFGEIQAAFSLLQKGSIKAIRTLLWAGLIHEDATLTEQQVGEWLGLADLQPVVEKITEALSLALPEGEEQENPKGDGIGAASTILERSS